MAIDEQSRHQLYERLQEILGAEEATTLMEHLPPVGWADVATKQDLHNLQMATKQDLRILETRMEAMEHRLLATVRAEMNTQTRTMIHAMIFSTSAAVVTVGGLAVAAARLL